MFTAKRALILAVALAVLVAGGVWWFSQPHLPAGVAAQVDGVSAQVTTADAQTLASLSGKPTRARVQAAKAEMIEWNWLEGTAAEKHIKLSDKDVAHWRALPKPKLPAALKERWARAQAIGVKLENWFAPPAKGMAGEDEIYAYYQRTKSQYDTPAKRSLLLLTARTRSAARKARDAVSGTQDWGPALNRYSEDLALKTRGGVIQDNTAAQLGDPQLAKAVFAARKGRLTGPVPAGHGTWAVFKVTQVTPATHRTFSQVHDLIAAEISHNKAYQITVRRAKDWAAKWTGRTTCQNADRKLCEQMKHRYDPPVPVS